MRADDEESDSDMPALVYSSVRYRKLFHGFFFLIFRGLCKGRNVANLLGHCRTNWMTKNRISQRRSAGTYPTVCYKQAWPWNICICEDFLMWILPFWAGRCFLAYHISWNIHDYKPLDEPDGFMQCCKYQTRFENCLNWLHISSSKLKICQYRRLPFRIKL